MYVHLHQWADSLHKRVSHTQWHRTGKMYLVLLGGGVETWFSLTGWWPCYDVPDGCLDSTLIWQHTLHTLLSSSSSLPPHHPSLCLVDRTVRARERQVNGQSRQHAIRYIIHRIQVYACVLSRNSFCMHQSQSVTISKTILSDPSDKLNVQSLTGRDGLTVKIACYLLHHMHVYMVFRYFEYTIFSLRMHQNQSVTVSKCDRFNETE